MIYLKYEILRNEIKFEKYSFSIIFYVFRFVFSRLFYKCHNVKNEKKRKDSLIFLYFILINSYSFYNFKF